MSLPGRVERAVSAPERRLALLAALSLAGVLLTATVVLVGAWTRLVDAGLGCPDWPGCYGQLLVPDADRARLHSPDAPLERFKAWAEMVHRYLASSLGLLVIAMVALGAPLRRRVGYPWGTSLVLLGLILLQGAFGAFTVTLRLWPQVVTLHLLGGLSVLAVFLWLHLSLRRMAAAEPPRVPRGLTPLWGLVLVLLVGQLALGGWVSSNYAGIACQGFPTCNGAWWPASDFGEGFHLTQTVGPSYLHGQLHADARRAIQVGHRLGALALGLGLLLLAWCHGSRPQLRPWLGALLAGYALQVGLGVANVLLWLPLWLALAHTAGAVALVVAMTRAVWAWRQPAAVVRSRQRQEEEWADA